MYYVYLLKSEINGFIYIGSCQNIEIRIKQHNSGKVKSTKVYRPWKLLEFEQFQSRSDAMKREKFLKTGQQREMLKNKFKLQ